MYSNLPPIFGLICNCGGAMPKFRQFLADSHVPGYMKVPVFQGDAAKRFIEEEHLTGISQYLKQVSAYTIIVILIDGGDGYEWVDVNNLSVANRIRAEAILERFVSQQ